MPPRQGLGLGSSGYPQRAGTLIEPSEDEKRNGWTAESLTAYHAERDAAAQKSLDWQMRPKAKPAVQNHRYSRFRRG